MHNTMNNSRTKLQVTCLIFLAVLVLLVFGRLIAGRHVLLTTDASISSGGLVGLDFLQTVIATWNDSVVLGFAGGMSTQAAALLKSFLSGTLWNNLHYAVACFFATLVFAAVFGQRFSRSAILFGTLVAIWIGSNFTLIYAGHGLKPYVVLFFVCSVASSGVSSFRGGLLWGAFAGLMFAQQPDVAMFFSLFAGAYLFFRLWQEQGWPTSLRKGGDWLKVLVPAAVVALLFAAGPLLSGYKHNVQDTAQVQTESPEERWHYITQWSMPPEEMIDFIAPNYTGIRSGEPDGPYWGRMGRSEGWEQHRQGFMNYRMESLYLGIIPIGFALFAVFISRWSKYRAEIIFWAVATLIALLLSFGKYFPLYALFYQLPVVNNIRNPNKFLQVFQVALAILTVYGMDGLFGEKSKVESRKSKVEIKTADQRPQTSDLRSPTSDLRPPTSVLRLFFWGLVVFSGVLVLSAIVVTLDRVGGVGRFAAQGWPRQAAQVIVGNQIYALWHAVFMATVLTLTFAVFVFRPFEKLLRFRNWLAAGLVLIVAVDAVKLSRDYVKEMPRSYIDSNALTSFLKENLEHDRVALVTQEGIYNIWLTYLLPYNRIPTFNFPAMPRMPIDYKNFLQAGSKDPLRMWRFSAVRYLLAPSDLEKQVPASVARKVFAYHLAPAAGDNVRVVPAPDGAHAVFELQDALPRYALLADYQIEPEEQALARLSDRQKPLTTGRLIEDGVVVLKYRPGRVELKTQSKDPAMLRAAERWDADWTATVDGETVDVQRIDFVCQGVEVPAGEHHVILAYNPSKLFFYMQVLGCVILFAAIILSVLRRRTSSVASGNIQIQET